MFGQGDVEDGGGRKDNGATGQDFCHLGIILFLRTTAGGYSGPARYALLCLRWPLKASLKMNTFHISTLSMDLHRN